MRAVLALALAAGTGCWSTPAPPPPVVVPPPKPIGDVATAVGDPLGFLPGDAGVVVRFDAERLRSGGLWARFGTALLDKIGEDDRATCEDQMIEAVRSVALAVQATDPPQGVAVVRGIEREAGLACLRARSDGAQLEIKGASYVWHRTDGVGDVGIQYVDLQTAVVVFGQQVVPATVDRIVASGVPLRRAPDFQTVYQELAQDRVAWFVIAPGSPALHAANLFGTEPLTVFGSIDLHDFLIATVHGRFAKETVADQVVNETRSKLGAVKTFVERADVSRVQRDVVIEVAATEAQLAQVLGMFGLSIGP